MNLTRVLLPTTAAGLGATVAASLVARHWRNHRDLCDGYCEVIDERDELGTLVLDIAAAVDDGRIPMIPPGYARRLRLVAYPGSCPTCGEDQATPRMIKVCDGAGATVCIDEFHGGQGARS